MTTNFNDLFGDETLNRLDLEQLAQEVQGKLNKLKINTETQFQYLKEQATRRKNEGFKRPIDRKEKEQLTAELVMKLGEIEEQEEELKALQTSFRDRLKNLKATVSETKQIIKEEARSVNDMVYVMPDSFNRVVVLVDPVTMKVVGGRKANDTDLQRQILD